MKNFCSLWSIRVAFSLLYFFSLTAPSVAQDAVVIYVEDQNIVCGETFTVDIYVDNFTNINGIQFSLGFDPLLLEYVGFTDNTPPGTVNIFDANVDNGIWGSSWFSVNPTTLPDGAVLYTLEFNHIGPCDVPALIELTDNPTPIEVSNLAMQLPTIIENGVVGIDECNVSVDLGEDIFLCGETASALLNPTIDGNVISFSWQPEDGLDDPASLNPTATVTTDMTYSLTVNGSTDNLLYNADFELGNTGFFSEYNEGLLEMVNNGSYVIIQSPDIVSGTFPPCVDHTTGSGLLMAINNGVSAGEEMWCQTVSVEMNTEYTLSGWFMQFGIFTSADAQFTINGTPVGPIIAPTNNNDCEWQLTEATWNSNGATTARICLTNVNTDALSNLLVADDFNFARPCSSTDMVNIDLEMPVSSDLDASICAGDSFLIGDTSFHQAGTYQVAFNGSNGCDSLVNLTLSTITVNAQINPADLLSCTQDEVVLSGIGSSTGPNISYSWSTDDGNIVSGANTISATVDAIGIYELVVVYNDGAIMCQSEVASIEVFADADLPTVTIDTVPFITCTDQMVTIETTPSSSSIRPTWSTIDGTIVSGANSFDLVVNDIGTYIIDLEDTLSGCTNSFIIDILPNPAQAQPVINGDSVLGCGVNMIELSGTNALDGDYEYEWFTLDGVIREQINDSTILTDTPGTYFFLATVAGTPCSDTTSITVTADSSRLFLAINQNGPIKCQRDTVRIEATFEPGIIYNWDTQSGQIVGTADTSILMVTSPGTYILVAADTASGCDFTDSVVVGLDTFATSIDAGPSDTLTCSMPSIMLMGSADSLRIGAGLEWSTSDGNIVSGGVSLTPTVNMAGTYILTATDSISGCSTVDSVFIIQDADIPLIGLISSNNLNCTFTSATISDTHYVNDADLIYTWSSIGGSIIMVSDSAIVVDSAGRYVLEVENTSNACLVTDTIEVELDVRTPVLSTMFDTITCGDSAVWITVGVMNAGMDPLITWSTLDGQILSPADSTSILVSSAGTYDVLVVHPETGCSAGDVVQVAEDASLPTIQIENPDMITCLTGSVILDATASDNDPSVIYEWFTGDGHIISGELTLMPTVDQPGTYTLTAVNLNTLCSARREVIVAIDTSAPVISLLANPPITCDQSTADILIDIDSDNPTNTNWINPNGLDLSDTTETSATSATPGQLFVEVIDLNNGCRSLLSIDVAIDTISPVADAGNNGQLSCTGDPVVLDGTGSTPGLSYIWMSVDGGGVINPDQIQASTVDSGRYQLTVLNPSNGCSSSDEVEISGAPQIGANLIVETPTCAVPLGSLEVVDISGGSGTYTFQLNNQDPVMMSIFTDLVPGTYTIDIQDDEGCSLSLVGEIPNPSTFDVVLPPTIQATLGTTVPINAQLFGDFTEPLTIQWSPTGILSCDTCLNPLYTAITNNSFRLEVTDINGCTDTASVAIVVSGRYRVYIPNAFSPNDDGTNDQFRIYSNDPGLVITQWRIFDRWGEQVFERNSLLATDDAAGWNGRFNGEPMLPGMYIYLLEWTNSLGQTQQRNGEIYLLR